MKDLKLIEAIVVTYYHENKDSIEETRLKEILIDSLNIDIGSVKLEGDILIIYYGPKNKRKKAIFEIQNEKIKMKKD